MKTASEIYKTLRAVDTSWYEWRVLQGSNVYELDKLKSIDVSFALTANSGIDIGNANAAECRMTLLEESANWQRMAKFTVQFRISSGNGGTKSEWITLGKFYTDERSEDQQGNLSIIGYDAMLKLEQTWTDKIPDSLLPASYPITARAWATMIQSANLATFNDIYLLDDSVAFIGLNTTSTIRDVLKSIAAVHAGNWMVLPDEKISLIPYRITTGKNLLPKYTGSARANEFYYISNSDGSVSLTDGSAEGTSIRSSASVYLTAGTYYVSGCPSGGSTSTYLARVLSGTSGSTVLVNETGSGATFTLDAAGYVRYQIRIVSGTTTNGLVFYPMICKSTDTHNYEPYADDLIDLGQSEQSLETSPALPAVTGVHLETEIGTVMESGNASGYVVKTICDVSATSGISDLCLSKIDDYVFYPFEAGIAYLDPRVDVGDSIKVDGNYYQVFSINWTLGKTPTADVSAPYDQEIDHEYTVPNQDTKTYRKAMSLVDEKMGDYVPWVEMHTAIEQNENQISLIAESTCVKQTDFDRQIAEIQSQLDGSIQTWSGNVVPTLNNAPAVDWITPTDKATHVGDTYFVNSDAGIPEAGNYYRFENNNGVYSWQLLTDSVLTEALAQAAAAMAAAEDAQDTADASYTAVQSKGRIYVVQPIPPYNVGDLWFNDTNSVIKVCMTARASGSFVSSDWVKRDKYIDDTGLEAFLEDSTIIQAIQNQLDHKAETYYQDVDPSVDWGAHPVGIAIAGLDVAGIPVGMIQAHQGDLWYRPTDGTTWFFDGGEWVQQDVPDEVFDKIDGKAQIFINEPYAPYNVGDLWFNSATSDIKTCIRARTTSGFAESDWEKRNKYTDDSALEEFVTETYESNLTVQNNAISAKVSKQSPAGQSSFSWELTDSAHRWLANNQEVMKVNSNGLTIKGNVTATTGYIGNSSTGFEITASAIRNGMTSFADTTHNGVYIGTDGIALGQGRFKVNSSGAVTATNLVITGGSISLGRNNNNTYNFEVNSAGAIKATSGTIGGFTLSGSAIYTNNQSSYTGSGSGIYIGSSGLRIGSKFSVDPDGNMRAGGATFEGNIYAKNILYNNGTYGTAEYGNLDGGAITGGTITGAGYSGTGGQIAPYTLGDYNVARSGGYGAYSTAAFNSSVQSGLYGGTSYNKAIRQNTAEYPAYFTVGTFIAKSGITANGNILATSSSIQGNEIKGNSFSIRYGSSSTGSYYDMGVHTHSFTENSNGTISIGGADWTGASHSFNIANTAKYKADVLASGEVITADSNTIRDFSTGYDFDLTNSLYTPSGSANSFGRINLKNANGDNLKKIRVQFPSAASVNDIDIWRDSGWITHGGEYCITVNAQATDANGNELYTKSREPISIQSEVNTAQTYGANQVYVTGVNHKSGPRSGPYGSKEMDVTVYLSNGKNFAATFNYPG